MAAQSPTQPVGDSVPKVDNDIAVGSDLEFQRLWWRWEIIAWNFFTILTIAALAGPLGRGHFSKARTASADGSIEVKYERVARGAPTITAVTLGPTAIHEGKARLWAGQSVMRQLGNQRIVPEPEQASTGQGGTQFTFPVSGAPARIEFLLQPAAMGKQTLELRTPGSPGVTAKIFVLP